MTSTNPSYTVTVGEHPETAVHFCNTAPLVVIAGPCVMESRDHALKSAYALKRLSEKIQIPLIYKTSFDKANRTSGKAYRGMGLEEALKIFAEIRQETGLPVITDVHLPDQCAEVASFVDFLQIPAFLCRQTDLLEAAALTGKPLHVKKGQFLAPWDMNNVVKKVESFDNKKIVLCERGVSFGYNTLVSDMRALTIMKRTGYPVVFDATHSVQQPGGAGDKSGGQREFVSTLAKAAVAVGVAGVFLETHEDPDNAPSDGPNMVPFHQMETLLTLLKRYDEVAKSDLAKLI
jgi:2-dehydro-3-deoxyphosphooctonate aldolase (KDO 8-P synthase)